MRMKLNTTSHVHKKIRLLCTQLELLSGMKLATDLSQEFDQIRFYSPLSYIMIDYKKNACFTLSYNMSKDEWSAVQDIILYLNWLQTGLDYQAKNEKITKEEKMKK